MKQHIEDVSPAIKRVELELSASRVDSLLDAAAREYGENLTLEGYRAGNAPPELVEKRFAKEVASLARQNMLDSVMDSLLREHKLYPVNKAAHDYCPLVRGQACSFNLYIEVIPPFSLPGDLSELTVRVKAPVVAPQEFFAALHKLRQSLKTEVLPALDDALAVKLGKKDLRSLQEDVYKELLSKVIVRHQREAEDNLLGGLLAAVDFEPPPSLVGIYRKTYLLQARAYFESQGLQSGEVTQKLEELTPEAEGAARGQAKAQAFLMALAYREKLVLSQEELKQAIDKMARQNRCDAARLEADLYSSNAVYELQDQLLADKALRHLYTKARKIVIGEDGNELVV